VYAAYSRGIPIPRVVKARATGGRGGYAEREAIAIIAEAAAPRSLRAIRIPFTSGYATPPVWLKHAAPYDTLYYVDYEHLYAVLAEEILAENGHIDEAGWFAAWRRLRGELAQRYHGRYVLLSAPSGFAEAWVLPGVPCRSGHAKRWWRAALDEPPLTLDEAVEALSRAPCRAYAVPVKALAKYMTHVVVGLSRRWATGLWEAVVTRSVDAMRELVENIESQDCTVAAYMVDAAVATCPPRKWRGRSIRVKARGPGLVVTPWTYRVGDETGIWGIHDEPPVVRRDAYVNGVLVRMHPERRGAVEALRCVKRLSRRSRAALETLLRRLGVKVGDSLCDVLDAEAGHVRRVEDAVEGTVWRRAAIGLHGGAD